jgi:hypothetical protein
MAPSKWQKRVDSGDWGAITAEVNDFGGALLPRLLTKAEAEKIRGLYPDDHLFRATIDMRRYRFGEGEYRYFQQPYPEPIQALKEAPASGRCNRPADGRHPLSGMASQPSAPANV